MPTTTARSRRHIPAIAVVALIVLGLLITWFVVAIARAAAPSDTLIIPQDAIPKAACSDAYSQVDVADLAQRRWTSCDMKGHVVIFPDGVTAEVGDVGSVTGPPGGNGPLPDNVTYAVENLGDYGVVAVRTENKQRQYWGTSRGVELLKQTRSGV